MAEFRAERRAELWIALGNQPGVSAWHAVWLLSRLFPPAPASQAQPEPAAAALKPRTRRVRAGTHAYQEQPRP